MARTQQQARENAEWLASLVAPHSPLPDSLIQFLDALPHLKTVTAINWLMALRGDYAALQQRDAGLCLLAMGLPARKLGLSLKALAAALGLSSPAHDALSTKLLDVVRGLESEVRNGTLLLRRIAATVNADCAPHEAITHGLLASRLRLLGFAFTRHHPTSVIVMPSLMHANGRNTQ